MDPFLDIRTLSLLCGIISASLILCLAYTYKYRKTYPGFFLWTAAFLFNFAGFVLIGLRGMLPDYMTVVLANAFIVICYVFIARGMNDFADSEQHNSLDIVPVAVVIPSFYYFSYIFPSVTIRIVIISSVLVLICLRCLYLSEKKIGLLLNKSNLLLSTAFLFTALWLSARIVLTLIFEGRISDFMTTGFIQSGSIIIATVGNLFIAFGLLSITSQRLEEEINQKSGELAASNRQLQIEIAERRQTQKQLSDSKALLDATGRLAHVGGWELDTETMAISWTEETYRIHEVPFDYKPPLTEAINFYHPDDQELVSQAVQRALDHGEPYDIEMRLITAENNHIWTRSICQPEVVNGRTVKLKGAFQDITDRKESEAERDQMIKKLQKALMEIKTLKGIVPICSHCKKIRDDKGYWNQLEEYLQKYSEADFSHGICPACAKKIYPDLDLYE